MSVAFVFVDRAFFDRSIYEGEDERQKLLGCFMVLIFNGISQFFYLATEGRFVSFVSSVPAQASLPLSYG